MITQGKWRFTTELSGMTQIRGGDKGTTADKSICAIGMENTLTDEDKDNAKLIADAPEMYEALKELIDLLAPCIIDGDFGDIDSFTLQPAKDAIAKVDGN